MAKIVPCRDAVVRLNQDITLRNGTKFRAGLLMKLDGVHGEYTLSVHVRGTNHWMRLKKRDYPRLFSVVSVPDRNPDHKPRKKVEITLSKPVINKLGWQVFKDYGVVLDNVKYNRSHTINLIRLTRNQSVKLHELLKKHASVDDLEQRALDVKTWIDAIDGKEPKVRRIKDFEGLLKQYLKDKPERWVYIRDEVLDLWQPHYVGKIAYHPPTKYSGAYVSVEVWKNRFDKNISSSYSFWPDEVVGRACPQILAESGWCVEDPARLMAYRRHCDRYAGIFQKVGMQFLASGYGDGENDDEDRWWNRKKAMRLDRGEKQKVVLDVVNESGDKDNGRKEVPDENFWKVKPCDHEGSDDDDDTDIKPGDEDDESDVIPPAIRIPLDPRVMVFDFSRHKRMSVHVGQLEDYKYNESLAEKLILPTDNRRLIDMMVGGKGQFKDIIGNKGSSSIILAAGSPGTGKTLSAEVYAEAMKRPLYSVHCSQLGTDPYKLEPELLQVFARAVRWNAILLIDEADVYVAARGSNLEQNAIVGVFLRVLEYYQGVMFMTTNRADLVDDAIASRCLARIEYTAPDATDQKRIWRVLADTAGVDLSDAEIAKVVKKYPTLSGRDCKNLLKLASMVAAATGEPVTAASIDFVKKFKPTTDAEK